MPTPEDADRAASTPKDARPADARSADDAPGAREWISEPVTPDTASFSMAGSANGEPAWPTRFAWRGRSYEIATFERRWKTTSADVYATGDVYVRRHLADVGTTCGTRLRLYFDRGRQGGGWYLHSRVRGDSKALRPVEGPAGAAQD